MATTGPIRRFGANLSACRGVAAGLGSMVLLSLVACFGDDDGASASADSIAFETPEVVTSARVLDGDPTSDRCPDATQPCFDKNKDILNGQHTLAAIDDMQVVFQSQVEADTEIRVATLQTVNSHFDSIGISAPPTATSRTLLNATALGAHWGGASQTLVRLELFASASNTFTISVNSGVAGDATDYTYINGTNNTLLAAAADFDGSGADKVVLVAGNFISVAAATTTADGVISGLSLATPLGIGPTSSLTTANFFGDGPLAVAAVTDTSLQVQFFSVDPASNGVTYLADKTRAVRLPAGHYVVPGSAKVVAGHFTDTTRDQVVLAFDEANADGSPIGVTLVLLDQSDDTSTPPTVLSAVLPGAASHKLRLAKGRFLHADAYEGVVVMQDFGVAGGGRIEVSLIGFPAGGGAQVKGSANVPSATCSFGMDTGNFDRLKTESNGVQTANRDMQLGLLLGLNCGGGVTSTIQAAIWQVSPNTGSTNAADPLVLKGSGAETAAAVIPVNSSVPISNPIVGLSMAVLDTQGRSKVLGPPTIVTIENHSQPSVVVAAPPMHVDWVGDTLTNLTAAPDGFFSKYTTSTSTDAKATTQATTTWSFSAEESVDGKGSLGDCETMSCLSFEDKFSAKQDLDGSTAALNGRFSSSQLEVSQATAFDDVVWFTDSTLTIYVYPVIGKTVCPDSKPGCSDAERVPLTLMVAGPDTVRQSSSDASLLPWYQPPWVPGNVLSYPATRGQLQAAALSDPSTFKALSEALTWAIDDTAVEQKASWINGNNSEKTVQTNGNFSFNNTLSFFAQEKTELASSSIAVDFSVGGSTGFKNLTDSQTTVTNSTGLSFSKSAAFNNVASYSYQLTPYIFAQSPPPPIDSADPTFDGFGELQSGFVVNLNTAGGRPREFWLSNYNAGADLALLHPARLSISTTSTQPTDAAPCVGYTSTTFNYDCASAVASAAGKLSFDEYRWMRGFFISDASAGGIGPQMTSAKDGDKLLLQARVHNLSLQPMAPGAQVKARFYGMVWDFSKNARVGSSFPICAAPGNCVQTLASPILPYHTDNDSPNWALVAQPFDTSTYGGKDLYFWVVVWMEDASGNLIAEPNQRGLSAKPTDTMDFEQVAQLEEKYGNNVGFFNSSFHVFEQSSAGAVSAAPTKTATVPSLTITEVGSEAHSLALGQSTLLAARVKVGEFDLPTGTTVAFYDGPPGPGAKLIGLRRQAFMRAQTTYDLRVPFHPKACGSRTVYIVTGPGTRFEHAVRLSPIQVACS